MENDNAALADSSLTSNKCGIRGNDNRIDLDLVAENNRSVRKSRSLQAMSRLMYLGLATIIYTPLVIAGVAFQNHLVYLAPAIPFLVVAFLFFLLRDISGIAYLKA